MCVLSNNKNTNKFKFYIINEWLVSGSWWKCQPITPNVLIENWSTQVSPKENFNNQHMWQNLFK